MNVTKGNRTKEKLKKKELDSEDVFCQATAILRKMYGETRNAECFVQTSNVCYGTANATVQRLSESKPIEYAPSSDTGG